MIPVCKPWLPGKEKEYVDKAIDTNWISSAGEFIEKFEEGFAKFCGTKIRGMLHKRAGSIAFGMRSTGT